MRRLLSLAAAICIFLLVANAFAQGQVVVKGEDEGEWKHPIKTDTMGRVQGVQAQNQLDACDVKTGWAALSNDTTGIDVDLDHVEGSASLELDKVDGSDNSVLGGCDKTLTTAVDIAHYMENNGFILVSMNVSTTTDIDFCFVRLGTDASNYNEWRVDDDALSAGWQQVRFPFYAPSTAGNLGNGIAATSVLYLAVGCSFDLETDTLADLRFDNIAVNTGFQTSADLQSQVATAAATPNINVVKIASQPVDVGAGAVGAGTQRNTLASDDPAVTSLGIIDDWDEVHDAAVGTDGALQMGESKDFDGAVLPSVVDTEGDAARLSLSLYGITYIMPVSEDGSETPLVAHDTPISAANGGSSGFMPMGESKDFDGAALPNVVDTEGDAVRPASSLYGIRYVMLVNEDGSAIGTILTSSEYLDDSGYTVTTDYVGAVGYVADTAAVDSVEEDDIGIPRMSLNRVPLGMIWDAGGNERGAHITAGNAVEMDVAEQSLTALKVSKDANANVTGNRIWVKSDTDMVGGTATNVNGGNRDAGTQTVAVADDDNVSTKLTDLDLKVTVEDLDTAAPVDNKQAVVAMLPSATGATLPDVGAGNVGGGTPRMTLAADDPAVANLTDIEGLLTSDNDAKELADYYDSTSQLKPFYVDDAALTLDNKGLANAMAAIYDLWGGVITAITQSVRMTEIDPAREWFLHDDVVTVTNGVDATYNYFLPMDGHRYHSMHFTLDGGSGAVTIKIYCTNQSGIAPAACAYQDYSNKAFGQASWTATGATVDNTMKFAGCTYIKYEVVAATGGANDADWELDASRWW